MQTAALRHGSTLRREVAQPACGTVGIGTFRAPTTPRRCEWLDTHHDSVSRRAHRARNWSGCCAHPPPWFTARAHATSAVPPAGHTVAGPDSGGRSVPLVPGGRVGSSGSTQPSQSRPHGLAIAAPPGARHGLNRPQSPRGDTFRCPPRIFHVRAYGGNVSAPGSVGGIPGATGVPSTVQLNAAGGQYANGADAVWVVSGPRWAHRSHPTSHPSSK
mmetsp:Transcript_1168/g.3981  ORF Transcript_1168/g.3981 Transcript_1168/m.3981 type:complete len:216 (+) Transcript_1168:1998-2645(+)